MDRQQTPPPAEPDPQPEAPKDDPGPEAERQAEEAMDPDATS